VGVGRRAADITVQIWLCVLAVVVWLSLRSSSIRRPACRRGLDDGPVQKASSSTPPSDRVHHRPQALVAEELVEGRDHRVVVPNRARRVVVVQVSLARHLLHGPDCRRRPCARRATRLGMQLQPHVRSRTSAGVARSQSTPTASSQRHQRSRAAAQQHVGVGAHTALTIAARREVPEELRNRPMASPVSS